MRSKMVAYMTDKWNYMNYGPEDSNQLSHLNSLMSQVKKTSLEISRPYCSHKILKYVSDHAYEKQLWLSPTNWIQVNGNKFLSLYISGEVQDRAFSLLHNAMREMRRKIKISMCNIYLHYLHHFENIIIFYKLWGQIVNEILFFTVQQKIWIDISDWYLLVLYKSIRCICKFIKI